MSWTLLVGAALTLAWAVMTVLYVLASRQVRPLAGVLAEAAGPALSAHPAQLPTLSIVITARDEAASIEATLRQALGQRYPDLQVIAVDDRSTDGTAAILDRMASQAAIGRPLEPLTVVHVRDLPPGWLGKCHACHVGARQARGAFLLFMDGDVFLAAPDLLERILTVVRDRKLDHLAIFPDLRPVGALQAGVVHAFEQGMLLAMRGWEMEADRSAG